MHSSTLWEYAPRPNYVTNIDKEYPYSELPFFSDYNLVKIPTSLNKLIDHVDYWGEGRIVYEAGVAGFTNCYNVNQSYRLVSNGPDKDKKIPNRIPVDSYDNCDTSAYIRDSSVVTVTVVGAPLNENCITDIARIVNNDFGKVIVIGEYYWEITNKLTNLLKEKSLYYYPHYELPDELQVEIQNNESMTVDAFLNENLMKQEFLKLYNKGSYEKAVNVLKHLDEKGGKAIRDIIMELLKSKRNGDYKIMSFVYTLWNNEGRNIIDSHFPEAFKIILSQDNLMIRNYEYNQPLKLAVEMDSYEERRAWGHGGELDTQHLTWRFIPMWKNNEVIFELNEVEYDLNLKLSVDVDQVGDRHVWGGHASTDDRYKYYVEPQIQDDGTLLFYIINYKYQQGLKLSMYPDKSTGDRKLYGHKGDIYNKNENRFKWSIATW